MTGGLLPSSGPDARRACGKAGDCVITPNPRDAYYSPGEGDRAVGVELGGGVFSVVVWMSDTSDAFSKKVAIEVFRAARPKVA
ncbi:hypothetical protein GCM10009827_112050 [Dactylosporangium maewongense]|uniref:Uncharacterized protein n=1 Tax=Dactylosporangium maewongense TaxID=634393 RepID=A0ABN2D712_9ACTN